MLDVAMPQSAQDTVYCKRDKRKITISNVSCLLLSRRGRNIWGKS